MVSVEIPLPSVHIDVALFVVLNVDLEEERFQLSQETVLKD